LGLLLAPWPSVTDAGPDRVKPGASTTRVIAFETVTEPLVAARVTV